MIPDPLRMIHNPDPLRSNWTGAGQRGPGSGTKPTLPLSDVFHPRHMPFMAARPIVTKPPTFGKI